MKKRIRKPRKAISLGDAAYATAMERAIADGISGSEYITRLICADNPQLQAEVPEASPVCECGNAKDATSAACERCIYLDGTRKSGGAPTREMDIISALRDAEGMGLSALCLALGVDNKPGHGKRSVLKTLQRLMRRKRVRRYWAEDSMPNDRDVFGVARGHQSVAGWVYALDGLTEAEWRRSA